MSLYDYQMSRQIEAEGYPFYSLVMALIRKADTDNLRRLQMLFPETFKEFLERYNAPGGRLKGERIENSDTIET